MGAEPVVTDTDLVARILTIQGSKYGHYLINSELTWLSPSG